MLDDLDRLLAQGIQAPGKSRPRGREPDQLFTYRDVDAARLQRRERLQGPLPVGGVPQPHLDAAVARRETAKRDARLAQQAANVIAQPDQDRFAQRVAVDREQDARSALLPERRRGARRLRGAHLFEPGLEVGREDALGHKSARRGQRNSPAATANSPAASHAVLRKFNVMMLPRSAA